MLAYAVRRLGKRIVIALEGVHLEPGPRLEVRSTERRHGGGGAAGGGGAGDSTMAM